MTKRKGILEIFVIILSVLILPITVYADMGPKDSLTVYGENPPSENYYLDLLTQSGTLSAYFTQFPVEIIILIAETAIYAKSLKGHSQKRRCAYGIIANLSSW